MSQFVINGIIHLLHSDRTCTCIKMSGITYTWINFNSKSQLCECIQYSAVHSWCYRSNIADCITCWISCTCIWRRYCRCIRKRLCACSNCRCRCDRCRNLLCNNFLFGFLCVFLGCCRLYNFFGLYCRCLIFFLGLCACFLLCRKFLSVRLLGSFF